MLPTIDEALKELKIAEELNPGPWVKHSINTGIAAKNIAEKVYDSLFLTSNHGEGMVVNECRDSGKRIINAKSSWTGWSCCMKRK